VSPDEAPLATRTSPLDFDDTATPDWMVTLPLDPEPAASAVATDIAPLVVLLEPDKMRQSPPSPAPLAAGPAASDKAPAVFPEPAATRIWPLLPSDELPERIEMPPLLLSGVVPVANVRMPLLSAMLAL